MNTHNQRYKSLLQRIWEKIPLRPNDGCWLWTGGTFTSGYGRIWVNGKSCRVHRVLFEEIHGPLAEGMCVLHKCDIRRCCRDDHLFQGTQFENCLDMIAKGRHAKGPTHYTKIKPWLVARGDRNGMRLHPESRLYGEKHWSYLNPSKIVRGAQQGLSKLTDEKVMAIRLLRGNMPVGEVSVIFGISTSTVYAVWSRRTWTHLL